MSPVTVQPERWRLIKRRVDHSAAVRDLPGALRLAVSASTIWIPKDARGDEGGRRSTRHLAVPLLTLLVAGCGLLPPDYTVHVSNATTLFVTVAVNTSTVARLAPETHGDYPPTALPPKPWLVEVRTESGRLLAAISVDDNSIQDQRAIDGTGEYSSVGQRVTLSCGQISVWVGEPGSGGGPAVGVPGDCAP